MAMELSCAMASTTNTPEHMRIAEELGYVSAWCFYSPAIYADPWMVLALAAERTSRIELGVSVVVPRFRHVADIASCTATLSALAPGRTVVGVGSGFSSTALLGGKGVPWAQVETYVRQLRALLAGQEIDYEGGRIALRHAKASGISLPLSVPIWIAAHGPKGFGVASRVGDSVITNPTHGDNPIPYDGDYSVNYYGTVLEDGESFSDPHVIERAGPAAALALHLGPYGPVAGHAEEREFTAEVESLPPDQRLTATHVGHLIAMSELDRKFVTGNVVRHGTLSGSAAEVRASLDAMEAKGAGRYVYTPVGPDIPRELEAFARAFRS